MKGRLAAVATTVALLAMSAVHAAKPKRGADLGTQATPPGVTLMHVRLGGASEPAGRRPDYVIFGSAANQALYFSDADTEPGRSNCYDACASTWIPFSPVGKPKPVPGWSVIQRRDGTKQWAFGGKPLYIYAKDNPASEAEKMLRADHNHSGGFEALGEGVDGHHASRLEPAKGMALPPGIAIAEVLTAPGQVFTDSRGMPLYVYEGKSKPTEDADLSAAWTPLAAPAAALPVGDFKPIERRDGIVQWTYGNKPLYLYRGDLAVGDSNGKNVDSRLRLAAVLQYFVPPDVSIIKDQRRGGIFITSRTGTAIYARDKVTYGTGGNHNSRGSEDSRGNPIVGSGLGLSGCDSKCEQIWVPFTARPDDQASGYWTVVDRPDGSKQWAYQGFALYTNVKDKGDDVQQYNAYSGHDEFDFIVNNDTRQLAPDIHGNGLYWRVVFP